MPSVGFILQLQQHPDRGIHLFPLSFPPISTERLLLTVVPAIASVTKGRPVLVEISVAKNADQGEISRAET